jgi:hypothetical protein
VLGLSSWVPGSPLCFTAPHVYPRLAAVAHEHTAAYRTLTAYTGKWRVDCEKFITKVDVAWNPAWVGTEQIRFWRLAGNRLVIRSAPISLPNPNGPDRLVVAHLVWEKEQ